MENEKHKPTISTNLLRFEFLRVLHAKGIFFNVISVALFERGDPDSLWPDLS